MYEYWYLLDNNCRALGIVPGTDIGLANGYKIDSFCVTQLLNRKSLNATLPLGRCLFTMFIAKLISQQISWLVMHLLSLLAFTILLPLHWASRPGFGMMG